MSSDGSRGYYIIEPIFNLTILSHFKTKQKRVKLTRIEQNYDPIILVGNNSNANYIYFLARTFFYKCKIWLLWYANVVKPKNREMTFRATIFLSGMTSSYLHFYRITSNTGLTNEKNQVTICYRKQNLITDFGFN